jgi:hypothetical protein
MNIAGNAYSESFRGHSLGLAMSGSEATPSAKTMSSFEVDWSGS